MIFEGRLTLRVIVTIALRKEVHENSFILSLL